MKKLLFAGICVMLFGMWVPSISASADELEEKVAYATDEEYKDIVESMISNTVVSMFSTRYDIDWKVPKKTRGISSYFYKKEGEGVHICLTLSKKAKVGIMGLNGRMQYVESDKVVHTYKIAEGQSQSYCVFVQNEHDTSITAKGYYIP